MQRTFAVLACGYPGGEQFGAIHGYLSALEDGGVLSGIEIEADLEKSHPHYEPLRAIAERLHPNPCRLLTFAEVRNRAAFEKRIPDLARHYGIRVELYSPQ